MNVDHFCVNTVSCQFVCCFQSAGYTCAGRDDRHILAFLQHNALADFKLILRFVIDHRNCCTSESEIYRPLIIDRRFHSCLSLNIIGRNDHRHAGNRSHQCNVLITLMGCSVLSDGNTCMGSADLYIQMRITDGISHLLKVTSCRKHGKRTDKRNLTAGCKSRRDTGHITLCDTAVNMALRKCLLENTGFGCTCKVSIQYNQIGIFRTALGKCITITFSCRDFLNISH